MQYMTEQMLRAIVMRNASVSGGARPDVLERWIRALTRRAKAQKRLLTERQMADKKAKRGYVLGDYARYVGETREEPVGDELVERPHGQIGRIVDVAYTSTDQVVTFRPLADPLRVDQHLVELVIRQGTDGWYSLERLEEQEVDR